MHDQRISSLSTSIMHNSLNYNIYKKALKQILRLDVDFLRSK